MKYLLILLFLFCQLTAWAQRCFKAYDAPTGGNEVTVFCVGQQVYFRDCAGIDEEHEYYDYDSSNGLEFDTPEGRAKTFTFTKAGIFTVTQFGNLKGDNGLFAQQFEVKATAAPAFTATACANRRVTVTVTDNSYDTYQLNLGDGRTTVTIKSGEPRQFTYATDGTFTLTLTGSHTQANCATSPAFQVITLLPALPAPLLSELTVINNSTADGNIRIEIIRLNPQFSYFLEELNSSSTDISSEPIGDQQQAGSILISKEKTDASHSRCFRVRATDACGTESFSPVVCTAVLSATSQTEETIQLDWQLQTGVQGSNNLQQTVELLQPDNSVSSSRPNVTSPYLHKPDGEEMAILRYRIKAAPGNGNYVSYSNIVEVPQPVRLFVPSAFTPNGDELNDVFEVRGKFFQKFSIKIYNNLGQVVYASSDAAAGWDGRHNGREMPQGAYVYEIDLQAADGTSRTRRGTVTLIR